MEGFIDVHSHILPGIDDGSKTMDQTMNMLRMAYEDGIRTIIATPHAHEGRMQITISDLEESVKRVQENCIKRYPDMKLYLGCEIYYSHESIRLLNEKLIPTIAGTRYILVEFSPLAEFRYIKNALQEFLLEGYYPIIAHVERYRHITKDFNNVQEIINMGAYIQVNAMSITGEYGKEYQSAAKKLLKYDCIHLLGTDSHSDGGRSPRVRRCVDYILKKYGERYVREMLINNGNKVLSGQYI